MPKKLLPAVQGFLRQIPVEDFSLETAQAALREINRGERLIIKQKHLYGSSADLDRIAEYLRFLRHVPLRKPDLQIVSEAIETLRRHQASPQSKDVIGKIAVELRDVRNRAAHSPSETPRSAYALDNEDDDA